MPPGQQRLTTKKKEKANERAQIILWKPKDLLNWVKSNLHDIFVYTESNPHKKLCNYTEKLGQKLYNDDDDDYFAKPSHIIVNSMSLNCVICVCVYVHTLEMSFQFWEGRTMGVKYYRTCCDIHLVVIPQPPHPDSQFIDLFLARLWCRPPPYSGDFSILCNWTYRRWKTGSCSRDSRRRKRSGVVKRKKPRLTSLFDTPIRFIAVFAEKPVRGTRESWHFASQTRIGRFCVPFDTGPALTRAVFCVFLQFFLRS